MKKKVYLRYMSNTNNQYIYDDASGNIFQWNNLYEEIINMYCEHNLTTITENLLGKYNIDEIQDKKDDCNCFHQPAVSQKRTGTALKCKFT